MAHPFHLLLGLLIALTFTQCNLAEEYEPRGIEPPPPISLSAGDSLHIMPLGDSLTEAFGYRLALWERMAGDPYVPSYVGSVNTPHPDMPDADHEGHGGWTIDHIRGEVSTWLARYKPDIVLLMIGTNDIAWWSASTADEIADEHARLVDHIYERLGGRSWLIVSSLPPLTSQQIAPLDRDRAVLVRDFNRALEQRMAARYAAGRRIHFVDAYGSLEERHLADGVHLTDEGYRILADTWYEGIQDVITIVDP